MVRLGATRRLLESLARPPATLPLTATLVHGRVAAGLLIAVDPAGNGYGFLVQPEERSLSWWRPAAARWPLFFLTGLAALLAIYTAYFSALTLYGPRYWYEALPFVLLPTGRGIRLLGQGAAALAGRGDRGRSGTPFWVVPTVLVGGLIAFNLTQVLPAAVRLYTEYNGIDNSSLRRMAAAHLDHVLVFVALRDDAPRRDFGKLAFANDPLLHGPLVYACDLGPERNRALLSYFPDRRPYYLPLTGAPQPGFGP